MTANTNNVCPLSHRDGNRLNVVFSSGRLFVVVHLFVYRRIKKKHNDFYHLKNIKSIGKLTFGENIYNSFEYRDANIGSGLQKQGFDRIVIAFNHVLRAFNIV